MPVILLITQEETDRLLPVVELIAANHPDAILSVDTFRAPVAESAIKAGAHIINDISGGQLDENMFATVARLQVPYILMHMKGTPQTMNKEAVYGNVITEVLDFFIRRMEDCRKAGIHDVILDPGMGFAKKASHNLILLKNLAIFKMLGRPILLGISRKSVIYKTLGITAAEALNGTTVLNTLGLLGGASIIRVHDPKEARQAIQLLQAMPSDQ